MACEKYDICPGFTRKKFCAHSEDVTVSPEKKENILRKTKECNYGITVLGGENLCLNP